MLRLPTVVYYLKHTMESTKPFLTHLKITFLSDLNGTTIEILDKPPSALQFSRLVHISRPAIIKGFDVAASRLWSNEYLIEKMGQRKISVAVTPDGFADALVEGPDGRCYFAEPCVEKMTMQELLNTLKQGKRRSSKEVHYLQSQNGNLFSRGLDQVIQDSDSYAELEPLRSDVPKNIPWCTGALGQPDAVNIWVGDGGSVTSIHSDPYENIYTVIRGEKHFTLLPPIDSWCMNERYYSRATYQRNPSGELEVVPSRSDPTMPDIRWSSIIDPDNPSAFPQPVQPIRISLRAGETLYLPVGWWHYVRQSDLTIAVNWWYDAELRGMAWVLLNVLRNQIRIPSGNENSVNI